MTHPPPGLSARTRERILDTAERLFALHGFAAASVREITVGAGANLGAVNYHFRSKHNLYTEVFVRRAALLRDPVVGAAREALDYARSDAARAFRALGRAFLAPYENRAASVSLLTLLAREVVDACLPPRLFRQHFFVPTIDAIARVARQARPDLSEASATACAHAFFAQLMHIVKGVALGTASVDERLEQAVQFTVAGVMHLEDAGPSRRRSKRSRKAS
jgi:AcrR family transcriptional regulator